MLSYLYLLDVARFALDKCITREPSRAQTKTNKEWTASPGKTDPKDQKEGQNTIDADTDYSVFMNYEFLEDSFCHWDEMGGNNFNL